MDKFSGLFRGYNRCETGDFQNLQIRKMLTFINFLLLLLTTESVAAAGNNIISRFWGSSSKMESKGLQQKLQKPVDRSAKRGINQLWISNPITRRHLGI